MSIAYLPGTASPVAGRDGDGRWPTPPNPGDLSRRVLRRRTELRLSREQVAARSRMSLRYLEYLERYPARPDQPTLRRLASALHTTPAALLGADADAPTPALPRQPATRRLTPAECLQVISAGGIGRIAFGAGQDLTVLPVNFTMLDGTVLIRTSEGTVVEGHGDDYVAFEIDHIDAALRQGWSVLIHGQAHRVRHPAEIHRITSGHLPWPWPAGEHGVIVRILPDHITGRRIEAT